MGKVPFWVAFPILYSVMFASFGLVFPWWSMYTFQSTLKGGIGEMWMNIYPWGIIFTRENPKIFPWGLLSPETAIQLAYYYTKEGFPPFYVPVIIGILLSFASIFTTQRRMFIELVVFSILFVLGGPLSFQLFLVQQAGAGAFVRPLVGEYIPTPFLGYSKSWGWSEGLYYAYISVLPLLLSLIVFLKYPPKRVS